jgi:predicted TIM-barrel fold metal-dependent hydrolase
LSKTMTDLRQHIESTPLADTHEHLNKEQDWVENGPDVLGDLFALYIGNDLITAGAPRAAVERLLDSSDPDIEARWNGVKDAWEHCQHTGYGRAVRTIAQTLYGIDAITVPALEAARERNIQLRQPGERLRLLQTVANLDHVQVDDFTWACEPDLSGPDFFLYDLSWATFASGQIDPDALRTETGVEVTDLSSLRQAMSALFAHYGGCAIAVKSQHAYERPLDWQERTDSDAEHALHQHLRGDDLSEAERLCLGDWCLARGVELAMEYDLPVKIHTGFLAGNENFLQPASTQAGRLAPLLARYPAARFVLMHIAYPYSDELIALAKHFPSVYVDMCWGWAINPYHAAEFVRRMLHAVPVNKLFAFGGDTPWPTGTVAYAAQARHWLTNALQGEIDDGFLTEAKAIALATRLMRTNQADCFDLAGTRAAIHARMDHREVDAHHDAGQPTE